ncbi:SRPBCC family protein [Nocardia sp. NBC_01327]|uniref:SRPBCC family protein n=1 Tax=Nocardia sp. NBC_01327 TaxID=2903593 RepID=UPI002E157728|nr:SRPBCC family protein [Nocardia sp. NBC_01327]
MVTVIIVVAVIVVLGAIAGGITALLLRLWTKDVLADKGFEVRPITSAEVGEFLDRATFTVTAGREFPFPPHKVWDALQLNGTFSWIPLINGIRYRDDYRREGALRSFDGLLFAVQERVIIMAPNQQLTVSGTTISIPFLIKAFAEDYRLTETADGTRLTWTIAFQPRIGSFLPLRWAAPFIRPFARFGLKGLASRI